MKLTGRKYYDIFMLFFCKGKSNARIKQKYTGKAVQICLYESVSKSKVLYGCSLSGSYEFFAVYLLYLAC